MPGKAKSMDDLDSATLGMMDESNAKKDTVIA